jgi:predicted CXXCH cytochrome family protein
MRVALLALFVTGLEAQDSAACGECHGEIYRSYMQTGMARSSGRVGTGEFLEKLPAGAIGAMYRIARADRGFRMDFEHGAVKGSRELAWFIGSGAVGRSYAFAVDGFLFQAPVSYYSAVDRWGLSPGYSGAASIQLSKPIEEPCLNCHASGVQPLQHTQNRYADPPFRTGGVSCERCHGRHPNIVNPAKLEASRRDSICEQCHLTGAARVPRRGRSIGTFRPGDRLSDHLAVFVREQLAGAPAATDHSEELARSRCKAASGDRLWCGTCHDPHSPRPATSKSCSGCHADVRHEVADASDCVSCHMPKRRSKEGEHVAYTDHTISRRPSTTTKSAGGSLRSYWKQPVDARDLAIAEPSLAVLEPFRSSDDPAVLAQLGQEYDRLGRAVLATQTYERLLRIDPTYAVAGAVRGIYRAREGRTREALALWQDVFSRNPALASVGINLATAQKSIGDRAGAELTIERLVRFHPDEEGLRRTLR